MIKKQIYNLHPTTITMTPKKYIHKELGREAELIDKEDNVYCFVDDDTNEHNFYLKELLALGFIEAPTDTEEKGVCKMRKGGLCFEHSYKEKYVIDNEGKRWYNERFVPKPVEQELLPLDVEEIMDNIHDVDAGGGDHIKIMPSLVRTILSKYGVPKQGKKEDWTDEEIKQWMNNIRGGTEEGIEYGIKVIKGFLTFNGIHKDSFKKRSEMNYTITPQATSVDVEEKISKIYEVIARKDLSFGCLVKQNYSVKKIKWSKILAHFGGGNYRVIERVDTSTNEEEYAKDFGHCEFNDYENNSFNIIGHPVMIGDVLDWIDKNMEFGLGTRYDGPQMSQACMDMILDCGEGFGGGLRKNMREPIENQTDECIDYIYSLVN